MKQKFPRTLVYPIIIVMLFDFIFTMLGQPDSYWRSFTSVQEASPLGFNLLRIHPLYFLLFFLLYLVCVYLLLRILPLFLAMILSISLFLGHTWGSASWINPLLAKVGMAQFEFSYWYFNIGYFIFVSVVTSIFVLRFLKKSI